MLHGFRSGERSQLQRSIEALPSSVNVRFLSSVLTAFEVGERIPAKEGPALGVDIPQPFDATVSGSVGATVSGSLGAIGPVTVSGIPDTFHIDVDKIAKIQLGLDPLTLNPLTLNPLTLNPLTITLNPLDLNLSVKELPSTRAHLPADFSIGFSFLGLELMSLRMCGEAQVITEPYKPNPCERCCEVRPFRQDLTSSLSTEVDLGRRRDSSSYAPLSRSSCDAGLPDSVAASQYRGRCKDCDP